MRALPRTAEGALREAGRVAGAGASARQPVRNAVPREEPRHARDRIAAEGTKWSHRRTRTRNHWSNSTIWGKLELVSQNSNLTINPSGDVSLDSARLRSYRNLLLCPSMLYALPRAHNNKRARTYIIVRLARITIVVRLAQQQKSTTTDNSVQHVLQ